MVKFTFDVPVARMVVEGKRRNVFAESFVLAALLREAGISGGDMFTRLPREGTERLQKEARRREIYDGDSDVLLLLSVFAEAIDRGLLHSRGEHSQRQSPEEWQRGESFWGWCKDAGIRGPSLVHAKHTIFRMLEEYNRKQKSDDKVSLDKDYLSEQLRMLVKNPEIIGEIITATYEHDILYASDTYGHLPDYSYVHQIKDSRGYSVLVNMSPGSRAFHAKPMVTVNIGGVKTGPGKGRRGVPITRNYANMNHTPSLIELRRAVPHLLEETIGERGYDQGKGRVYKTKVYTLKKSGQRIGTEKEVLLGKDAIPGIANALAQRSVQGFPYADENMQALEALRQFARKTGGAVQVPEMNEWYEKQLQDAPEDDPYAVLENTPDLLRLTIEEFVLKEEQEKYNEVYPDVVTIAGNECRVEYTYNPRSTYAEEQYVARVQIPSAEALFATPEEYSVVFGEDENTPRVTYMLASKGRRFEEESVAVLQEKVDAVRIQHEWEMWSSQKEKKILSYEDVREGVPMPGVFGINTEAYATTQKGTPVYAYPAIDAFEIAGDGDEREWRFTVAYYKSEDEARVAQEGAVAARKEFLQEAKRRKDVAEQLPALRERADSLAERVEYFFHKYDSIGIPYEEIRLLESDWNDVRYGIEGKELRDTYVRNAVIQPSSIQAALQQVDERLDAFAGYAETFEEKKRQLKEYFEKNKEKMKPLLDARYYTGSWARHGFFSRDDFNDCVGAWDVVSRASNTVGAAGLTIADIDDAILNAEKVETLLSQSDFEIWNTPVAQAYLEQKETKNRGIYARIRVSEGGVSLLEDGVFVNTNSFIVGQSGRNARVVSKSSNGGVVLQGYYSSGNTMTGNVVLPNGDYDIFRDMDHVFEVERDETEAETVRKVVREVSVYGGYEDDGEGDMTYSSNTRASFSAPEVSTDTRGSVLADAILAAQQDKKPKTKNTQQEIKDQSPRNDRHVESLITEEWKKEREAEMYALEGVLSILSRFLKRFAPNETMLERDATKREKSIEKLRRRLPEERHSLTEIIKRLSETTKGESSTSVSGGIETVRRSVQALVKDADRNMRGGDGSWFDSVLEAYTGVDAAITDSADAQEYIEGGLVVSSDVRQKVFEYLSNEVSETLEHVSYDEYIQRALNELTE